MMRGWCAPNSIRDGRSGSGGGDLMMREGACLDSKAKRRQTIHSLFVQYKYFRVYAGHCPHKWPQYLFVVFFILIDDYEKHLYLVLLAVCSFYLNCTILWNKPTSTWLIIWHRGDTFTRFVVIGDGNLSHTSHKGVTQVCTVDTGFTNQTMGVKAETVIIGLYRVC